MITDSRVYVFSIFSAFFCGVLFSCAGAEEEYTNPYVQMIQNQNMRIFSHTNRSHSCEGLAEWVEYYYKMSVLQPEPRERRSQAFEFFKKFDDLISTEQGMVVDQSTCQDLNFFCGDTDKKAYLGDRLARTSTELGRILLYCMLADPKSRSEFDLIRNRQMVVKTFMANEPLLEQLDLIFKELEIPENAMMSISGGWNFKEPMKHAMFDRVPGLKFLNSSKVALQLRSLFLKQQLGLGSFMMAFSAIILPIYAWYRFTGGTISDWLERHGGQRRNGSNQILSTMSLITDVSKKLEPYPLIDGGICLLAALFCAANLKNQLFWFCDQMYFEKVIQRKLIEIRKYVDGMQRVYECVAQNEQVRNALPSFSQLDHTLKVLPTKVKIVKELFSELSSSTFKGEASYFSFHGRVLAAFHLLHQIKDLLKPGMYAMAEVDVYLSMARLMREHQNTRVKYSFVDFIDADKPTIELENVWNPLIDADSVVPSSICLGGSHRNNGIVTGPNAGGKSTTLKAIALSLLLGQTFGIAPASTARMTPFAYIRTYLNIKDDIGVGNSLFKSEVLRAQELIERVENLGEKEFSFVAIDEMFCGTSPVEGAAAAYSVARHLGAFDKSICMIATHFPLLTRLEDEMDSYSNYKVSVELSRSGKITYPFILEKGKSHQNVAINILRDQGFNSSILDAADHVVQTGDVWE